MVTFWRLMEKFVLLLFQHLVTLIGVMLTIFKALGP